MEMEKVSWRNSGRSSQWRVPESVHSGALEQNLHPQSASPSRESPPTWIRGDQFLQWLLLLDFCLISSP